MICGGNGRRSRDIDRNPASQSRVGGRRRPGLCALRRRCRTFQRRGANLFRRPRQCSGAGGSRCGAGVQRLSAGTVRRLSSCLGRGIRCRRGHCAGVLDGLPALGPNREHQQRWQRTAEAWRRIDDAQRRLQRLWSDALREAAAAFAARLGPLQAAVPRQGRCTSSTTPGSSARRRPMRARLMAKHFCEALAEFVNAEQPVAQGNAHERRALVETVRPAHAQRNQFADARLRSVEAQLRAARARNRRRAETQAAAPRPAAKPARRRKPSDDGRSPLRGARGGEPIAPPGARKRSRCGRSGKLTSVSLPADRTVPPGACPCSSSMRWSTGRT